MTALPLFGLRMAIAVSLPTSMLLLGTAVAGQHSHSRTVVLQNTDAPTIVSPADPGDTGFLVVAPDRGFLGNEEIRDVFAPFEAAFVADLAFIPWEGDPGRYVETALGRLQTRGVARVAVLPLFLTSSHSLLERLREYLASRTRTPDTDVKVTAAFGDSFLAAEILGDRFRAAVRNVTDPDGASPPAVLLVGYGALDAQADESMQRDLEQLLRTFALSVSTAESAAVTLRYPTPESDSWQTSLEHARNVAERLANAHGQVVVLPVHLGQRMDSMMDLNQSLRRNFVDLAVELAEGPVPHADITTWMAHEANRWIPLDESEIGFVIMPHGSSIDWNESIRQPLRELTQNRLVEFAFSMADAEVLNRAVKRLETRGARGIVVLRVFSQESSFRSRVEFLLGLGDEPGGMMMMGMGSPPRVRSAAVFTTLGGIENDALFAEALLDRARDLSESPASETVLLLGHGAGRDEDNRVWLRNLESIASQMQDMGAEFAAIRWANWREDWPAHREAAEAEIHALIASEHALGRTVLVIPARTTLQGPEPDQLGQLDSVRIGTGFAPHPLFARWVRDQLDQGAEVLQRAVEW